MLDLLEMAACIIQILFIAKHLNESRNTFHTLSLLVPLTSLFIQQHLLTTDSVPQTMLDAGGKNF